MASQYLVLPPADLHVNTGGEYCPGHSTYSSYNYVGDSPVARVKRRHFEVALSLTSDRFGLGQSAIDMGCADGFLLPSLSRQFEHVFAVDIQPTFCAVAESVATELGLDNVSVICNRSLSWEELAARIPTAQCSTLYLLETLEHVGNANALYESKIEFLKELFGLVTDDGVIAISVPTMVGIPFLLQRLVLTLKRMPREKISPRQLFRSVVLRNADEMESSWSSLAHLGFNHLKLERYMRAEFHIVSKRNLFFSQVYVIRQK